MRHVESWRFELRPGFRRNCDFRTADPVMRETPDGNPALAIFAFAAIYIGVLVGAFVIDPLEGSLLVMLVFFLDAFTGPQMTSSGGSAPSPPLPGRSIFSVHLPVPAISFEPIHESATARSVVRRLLAPIRTVGSQFRWSRHIVASGGVVISVTSDERIGTELLGYRIEAVIGRGGMGVVYRAHDPRLKRNVALKLLVPKLAEDERFRERFLSESELAASLDHPNVVPIYEAGEAEGVLYVAMRYVDGKDLKTLLREEGALEPIRALAIVSQIAAALDAAHDRGLVHRDVKPSNVLLDEREHVYLADFGLTRRLSEQAPGFEAGLSLGTPAYVAPEQIEGKEVDGQADQYSLCCLLYECLTGTPPFPRSSEAAVLFAHLEEEAPAPERLKEVMARGLAKDPAERYPSCGELVAAARTALGIAEPKRPRWPFVVAGVGAAVLGAALVAIVLERGGSHPVPTVTGSAVAEIDPQTNRLSAAVPVSGRPDGIAYGSGSLWVTNPDDRTVMRLDPDTRTVARTLSLDDKPTAIAASRRAVWVVGSDPIRASVSVRRIDPQFDVFGPTIRLPNVVRGSYGSVATGGRAVWVAPAFGLLTRLDPRTSRIVDRLDPNAAPSNLVVGADGVWVTDTDANTVTRVDQSGDLTAVPVGQGPVGIAVGAGSVWVVDYLDDAVVRIDPGTRRVTSTIPVGRAPIGIAVGAGSVWVANSQDGTVTRIDPVTGKVVKTIDVGGSPLQIAIARGRVWVTVQPETVGARAPLSGGTARLTQELDEDTLDPAFYPFNNSQLQYATCARLLNYPDKPAPAGARLVPEVAESMPTLSSDRRTYTFTIRKGFRFSPPSNEPVTAQTFKYALERALSPKMPGASDGARTEFRRHRRRKGVHGGEGTSDRRPRGAEEPARDPAARTCSRLPGAARAFFLPRTARYAARARRRSPGSLGRPLLRRLVHAGAGSGTRAEPELQREPPSPPRADRADLRRLRAQECRRDRVRRRRLCARTRRRASRRCRAARRPLRSGEPGREARRAAVFPAPARNLDFFLLNTHRPLFRDVRLRRAVNYAIDRRALARIGRGWTTSAVPTVPTDQYLPPGVPGFKDVGIYPATPDLAAARRLAGGRRRTAVLYTCNDSYCERLAQVVKRNLKAIDIHVAIKAFPVHVLFTKYVKGLAETLQRRERRSTSPRPTGEATIWDPAASLNAPLERVFFPTFDDPAYRRKLAAAARLSGPRRYLAYQKLDADLARNAAPWLAYANELRRGLLLGADGVPDLQPLGTGSISQRSASRRADDDGPGEARQALGRRETARPEATPHEDDGRAGTCREGGSHRPQPIFPPPVREPNDDERRFVRGAQETVCSRRHEERLGGNTQSSLNGERSAREESARVASSLLGTGQPKRNALVARYPGGEFDRGPVVLRPRERNEHGSIRRRRIAADEQSDIARRPVEDSSRDLVFEQCRPRIEKQEVDVLLRREANEIDPALARDERSSPSGLALRDELVSELVQACSRPSKFVSGDHAHDDQLARRATGQRPPERDQRVEAFLGERNDEDRTRRGDGLCEVERRVLLEDLLLELLQRRAGLESQPLDESLTRRLVRSERFGLPTRAVEGKHELSAKPLPQRVLSNEHLELCDELRMAPECEVRLDPTIECDEPELLETPDRRLSERFVRQLGERWASPDRKSLAKPRLCNRGLRPVCVFDKPLEAIEVELARLEANRVAG